MANRDTKADEIRTANQKISRPEDADAPSAGRAGRLLRADIPAEIAGAVISGEKHDTGETEETLRRASEKHDKQSSDS